MRIWLRRLFCFLFPFQPLRIESALVARSHLFSLISSPTAVSKCRMNGFCDLQQIRKWLKILQHCHDVYFILYMLAGSVKINIVSMLAFSASNHNMRNYMNDLRCSAICTITRPSSRYFSIKQKPVQCNAHYPYIINAFFYSLDAQKVQ